MLNLLPWASKSKLNRLYGQDSYFIPSAQFELAAAAERMRVDRNGSLVSMLLLRLSPNTITPANLRKLEAFTAKRLRLTDTVGWLRDGRLGVLLPDTEPAGAWKVATDLCEYFPAGNERPDCEVVVYPEQTTGSSAESTPPSQEQEEPVATSVDNAEQNGQESQAKHAPLKRMVEGVTQFEALTIPEIPTWKRGLDIIGSSIGLIALGPVIIGAALAVKLTSPGGAFFLQEREGLAGRRFKMYKLRTMRNDAEALKDKLRHKSEQDGPAFKIANDPRITSIGRFLRKTSLDELPQLFNVLRGEMSLVGPRPLPIDESLACQPWQRQRLRVPPGVTCIWQIYGRNTVLFDDWIRMDLEYAAKQSLWLDLKLVACTAPALISSKGR